MEELFHYTTTFNAIQILNSLSFRFGHLENTNDPFERLENRISVPFSNLSLDERVNNLIDFSKTLSIACFAVSKTENDKVDQKWTMWAHYAKRHSGVCLVFNKESFLAEVTRKSKSFLNQNVLYSTSVTFLRHKIEGSQQHSNIELLTEFKDSLLFQKHIDWSCESEYRIVVFQKNFDIPISNSLNRIICGPNINSLKNAQIRNLIKNSNLNRVKFGQLRFMDGTYGKPMTLLFD